MTAHTQVATQITPITTATTATTATTPSEVNVAANAINVAVEKADEKKELVSLASYAIDRIAYLGAPLLLEQKRQGNFGQRIGEQNIFDNFVNRLLFAGQKG